MKRVMALILGVFFAGASLSAGSKTGSLYDLPSVWRNTKNEKVGLGLAKGKPVLIAMIYTSCAHSCPMTVNKINEIKRTLVEAKLEDPVVILASFDVKRDRPAKLKKYQSIRKLDESQWIFLSPESELSARELAVVLGVNYKDLGNGDFSHSNSVSLLDSQGHLVASINSLSEGTAIFVNAMKAQTK